jgi:hypothetical protein
MDSDQTQSCFDGSRRPPPHPSEAAENRREDLFPYGTAYLRRAPPIHQLSIRRPGLSRPHERVETRRQPVPLFTTNGDDKCHRAPSRLLLAGTLRFELAPFADVGVVLGEGLGEDMATRPVGHEEQVLVRLGIERRLD